MHVNVCTLVGRVSPAGPKLGYASSGTPVCSLVVEVDEMGPGEKIFTTWLPVRITGKHAEQTSVELEPGDIVMVSGKLKYESSLDLKTNQKTSKLIISTWGIQQREPLVTSQSAVPNSTSGDAALNLGHSGEPDAKPARKPRYSKHLQQPWVASRLEGSEN